MLSSGVVKIRGLHDALMISALLPGSSESESFQKGNELFGLATLTRRRNEGKAVS